MNELDELKSHPREDGAPAGKEYKETITSAPHMSATRAVTDAFKRPAYSRLRIQFALAVGLQVAILTTMYGTQAYSVSTGKAILLQAHTYDPWDMFRGDYVNLAFDIGSVKASGFRSGDTIYVVLKPVGRYWNVERVSAKLPESTKDSEIALRGVVSTVDIRRGTVTVNYGIEHCYVPEKTGNKYQNAKQLTAELSVDRSGHGVLRKVEIAN